MPHATTVDVTGLLQTLDHDLDELARDIRRAEAGNVTGVHRARVASRRLRESLPLVVDVRRGPGRSAARDLRGFTRALGGVREMDVARQVLAEVARRSACPVAVIARVDRVCEARRAERRDQMRKALDDLDARELSDRIRSLIARVDPLDRQPAAAAIFHTQRRTRSREFIRAIRAAGTLYAVEPLHELRIAAKKLRYTLELAPGAPGLDDLPRRLKALQQKLGDVHDLQSVQHIVQEVSAAPDLDRTSTEALRGLDLEIEARCRAMHARVLKLVPDLIARVRVVVRDSAARAATPRRPRPARISSHVVVGRRARSA